MSAILSFLGGGAFRAIWGEFSSWMTKRQDHKHELTMLRVQGELDAAQHTRNLEAIRVQADLGVKTIQVQADADLARTDAEAFRDAVAKAATPSGVTWIDGWNAAIRPMGATIALVLWIWSIAEADWILTAWTLDLMGSIFGWFYVDRTLRKRNK